MSSQYCFLCASDEGVFLDVTADNKQMYYDQLEICSLIKVLKADQLPTKICHKCAYELNQCSSFIEKYKRTTKQKINVRRQCCSLCREPAKNEFIFDISKEKNLQYNPFHKIQELLNTKNSGNVYGDYKFICLSCRYVIDVLIDLKNICEETTIKLEDTADKKINYLTFPKIKTTIVNRKTTSTEPNRINLNAFLESESDSDRMTRTRSRNNKLSEQTKSQVCSKCHNSIKTDDDIFKIHKTGEIVCKCCWKNMDICKSKPEKEVSNDKQIKLCTVFLKDVLKDSKIKKEKLYRIDEDDEGNKTYVVMATNLTNENKSSKPVSDIRNDIEKQSQKRSSKSVRTADKDSSNEDVPNKKHKPDAKEICDTDSKQSSLVAQQTKQVTQKGGKHNINQSFDSDSSIPKIAKNSGRRLTRHKRATGSSLSDADIDNKYNRKRLKTILSGIPIRGNRNVDVSDESSSNEDVVLKRKRLSFTSTSSVTIEICDDDNDQENFEKNIRKTNRKNTKKLAKLPTVTNSQELQSPKSDDKDDIFKTQTYVCDECGASYENKFIGLTHKLTHYKQPQLKLQKLSNETWMKETSGPSEALDDQVEDLSETIKITVEDDEEELMESEKNFNTSNHADINSNAGSNINSPKKEVVEDAVDVKLVMKESDDDQTHKTEKETEDLQEDEVAEINIISPSQNETKTKEDTDKESEKENEDNYNNNDETDKNIHESIKCVKSEEIMKISHSDSEDKQKNNKEKYKQMEEDKQENEKDKQENEKDKQENEKDKQENEKDKQENEKDKQENEEDKRKNEKGKQENEENKRENYKGKQENEEDKCKVEEKQTKIVEEVEKVKVVEEVKVVKERGGEEDEKRDLDIKDDEEGKQEKERKEAMCNGQAIQTINKESLKKFSENCVEDTMEANDIDISKKIEQSDIKQKETNNRMDVADDEGDLTILAKQRSPKSIQKIISCNENRMQIKVDDSDSKKSEVLERTVLLEEDTTDKENFNRNDLEIVNVDSPQRKDSISDSANAAAEVLREVLDLASAEVVKRQEVIDINIDTDSIETETLGNISHEIQNIVDMPSLKIDDSKTENETHVE
ncbi:myb-like protein X [Bombus huntii]|uniref:myb-like protein X n=1 Tax=Bombus huntii TaxID=85661 RepID=UPI0021A9FF05|nr:myb-like protein X [Bombus huntii]